MPRDGSNIYHRPPGTDGIPDTTIESAKYNINVADVEQDLNLPRPIVAGGTGASNARSAMINLKGEISEQVVTNYDSFAFAAGSFTSLPGAISAPDPDSTFSGVCHVSGGGASMFLEARPYVNPTTPSPCYVREKLAGFGWGPWFLQTGSQGDADQRYVLASGDSMFGALQMENSPIVFDRGGIASSNLIYGNLAGKVQWRIDLGTPDNASDFVIRRFDDAQLSTIALSINRYTGVIAAGPINVTGNLTATGDIYANSGIVRFGSDPLNHYLRWTGSEFNLTGGALSLTSGVLKTSTISFSSTCSIFSDGNSLAYRTDSTQFFQNSAGTLNRASLDALGYFTIALDGYKPGGGSWSDSSDARIKNVLGDYASGLDEILALHPKRYTYKGNDTVTPPVKSSPAVPYTNSGHHAVAADGKEFIGLIAQDAEPVMPEMVTQKEGYIDGVKVTDLRELNTTPLVFALVNAVKQLAARVEELEARQPAR